MNDIEKFVVAIKDRRQHRELRTTQSELPLLNQEFDVPTGLNKPNWETSEVNSDASNDTLQQDVATDFGLLQAEDDQVEAVTTSLLESDKPELFLQSAHESKGPSDDTSVSSFNGDNTASIILPLGELTAKGFITPSSKRSLMTEQYRRIKRPLLKNLERNERLGESSNVIMVTSSVSGEGKTFTSINLAMSLAMERDKSVLLVDMDVLKNSASDILGVHRNVAGLTDLLVGDVHGPSDVILRTNIVNLSYLPSGSSKQHTSELLSSVAMKTLFDELSGRYHDRIIVLDCPPILQTNEATVITDYAGQVVFVVAEEDTSQSYVVEALSQIPKETYVGLILNKSRKRILGNDYGYTYEYG